VSGHKNYIVYVLYALNFKTKHLTHRMHLFMYVIIVWLDVNDLAKQQQWSSLCNLVKKYQLDAQLILSIFRQPPHVSGVSRPIIRRYNSMYTTIDTYISFRLLSVVLVPSTNCCIHTVVPPDDRPRYPRNT